MLLESDIIMQLLRGGEEGSLMLGLMVIFSDQGSSPLSKRKGNRYKLFKSKPKKNIILLHIVEHFATTSTVTYPFL